MREIMDGIMLIFLGIAAWGDWKRRMISVNLLIFLSVFSIAAVFVTKRSSVLEVLGGLGLGMFFIFVSYLTEEKIGYGDSWLITVLGVYLGGTKLLELMLIASLTASLGSLLYGMMRKWNRNAALPFIPFMLLAFVGVLLL